MSTEQAPITTCITSFNNYKLTGSLGNRFFDNQFGVLVSGGLEQVDRSADQFSAGYASNPTEEGDQLLTDKCRTQGSKTLRERANGSLVLDYKNDFMSLKFNNIYSTEKRQCRNKGIPLHFCSNSNYDYNIMDEYPEESFQMHSLGAEFKMGNSVLDVDYSYSRSGSTGTGTCIISRIMNHFNLLPLMPSKGFLHNL